MTGTIVIKGAARMGDLMMPAPAMFMLQASVPTVT